MFVVVLVLAASPAPLFCAAPLTANTVKVYKVSGSRWAMVICDFSMSPLKYVTLEQFFPYSSHFTFPCRYIKAACCKRGNCLPNAVLNGTCPSCPLLNCDFLIYI